MLIRFLLILFFSSQVVKSQNPWVKPGGSDQRELEEIYRDLKETDAEVEKEEATKYKKTDTSKPAYIKNYEAVFLSLKELLRGRYNLPLKKIVFHCENAWHEGKLSEKVFESALQEKAELCRLLMQEKKLDGHTALQMLYKEHILLSSETKQWRHAPFTYDFSDFWGDKNYSQLFVSKLLRSGKGQCHSMPLLYKLLADELGLNCWLAYAPQHLYILYPGSTGLQAFECTNGHIVSAQWMLEAGYCSLASQRSKVYGEPLNRQQEILLCLGDLAESYLDKYRHTDALLADMLNTILDYDAKNLHALLLQHQVFSSRVRKSRDPFLKKLWQSDKEKLEQRLDELGYQYMPREEYEAWLKALPAQALAQKRKTYPLTRIHL